jgi:hypothetical protein
MNDKKESNVIHGKWTPILVACIGAFLGSTGTVAVVFGTPFGQEVARPDPYTGTQAAALISRVDRVDTMITGHIFKHPDHELDIRVARLEEQYVTIIKNQDRIIRIMDGK